MPLDGFALKQTAYEQRVSQILWGPHYAKRHGVIEVFALFFPLESVVFDREKSQASVLTLIFPSFHRSLSIPTSPQGYLAWLQPRWPELSQQPAVHLPTVLCQLCAHSPVCPHQCGGSCAHETSWRQQQGGPGGCRDGCWAWDGNYSWVVLPQVRLSKFRTGKRSKNRRRWW